MGVHAGEAHRGLAKYGLSEVQLGAVESRGWSEVVGLLRLGENVGDIVPLVAPRVHVDWRVEDSECGMKDQSVRQGLR